MKGKIEVSMTPEVSFATSGTWRGPSKKSPVFVFALKEP